MWNFISLSFWMYWIGTDLSVSVGFFFYPFFYSLCCVDLSSCFQFLFVPFCTLNFWVYRLCAKRNIKLCRAHTAAERLQKLQSLLNVELYFWQATKAQTRDVACDAIDTFEMGCIPAPILVSVYFMGLKWSMGRRKKTTFLFFSSLKGKIKPLAVFFRRVSQYS